MAFDWGSLIGAAVSLYGAKEGADAAKDAGKQSAAGAQASNDLIWKMFEQQNAQQQPFYQAGVQAQDRYLQMMGLQPVTGQGAYSAGAVGGTASPASGAAPASWFGSASGTPTVNSALYASDPKYKAAWDQVSSHHQGQFGRGYNEDSDRGKLQTHMQQIYGASTPGSTGGATSGSTPTNPALTQQQAFDTWRATPGYQFGLDEGNKQVQSSAAARGGLNSGATLKALQRYGTDYADQQGYTPYMNKLAGLFGGAQTAAGQMGSYGQNAANQMGQNTQNAANARANSTYAANQAWQGGAQDAWSYVNKAGANQGWWG